MTGGEVSTERVTISGGAIELAGLLRVPAASAPGPLPAVVLTGPFTGVKEQVVSVYARALSAAGYVTLAFDHRGWGESGGDRRQHEDAAAKIDDLGAATTFLERHPAVDPERIACVGICLGGAYALLHTAFDPRIRAAAFVAAAFNDPRSMRDGFGQQAYRETLAALVQVRSREDSGGEVEYLPAVDPDGGEAAMPGREPWDYYGTERSAAEHWSNRVTRSSIRTLLTLDASVGADLLAVPALWVHGRTDAFCSPEAAEATFVRASAPAKDLVWLDTTNHIDLYDVPAYVDPAAEAIVGWFAEHLR